jgi:hypothetical protein
LPYGIPSSFKLEGKDNDGFYSGSIKYSIKAYTYENAKSYGDVINENKHNLLYNFEKDSEASE